MRCTLYLIVDSAYPIRPYLMKNWKALNDVQKKRFDSAMNSSRVTIENAFGALKNRWRILGRFNSRVDKAVRVTVACCWLHNYCKIRNEAEPYVANVDLRRDPLIGFGNARLPLHREEEQAKRDGERLKERLYNQWVLQIPNE